ncbi:hypothetical protein CVT26_000981, partial [Gymnopilus dilepis]
AYLPLEQDWPDNVRVRYGRSVPVQQVTRATCRIAVRSCRSQSLLESLPPTSDAASLFVHKEKRKLVGSTWESSNKARPSKKARLDIEVFLNDMKTALKTIMEDFQNHPHISKESWFYRLNIQYRFVDEIRGTSEASSLLENLALALPYHSPSLILSLVEPHDRSQIKIDFERIEALRREILFRATDYMEDTPLSPTTGLPFPEIIFLSMPFYHYSLLRSHAPECCVKLRKDVDFMSARKAARRLFVHASTPEFFQDSNRIDNFRKILIDLIPGDNAHHWVMETLTPVDQNEILVYRRHEDNHPLLLATITVDDEEADGTAFSEIIRKYSHMEEGNGSDTILSERGIPVLFIQLTDTYFLVGGAMSEPVSGLPIVQRLPGSVDMTEDFGYNLLEATYTIWTLGKTPSVGLEGGGITVTAAPWPGILYKVKLDFTQRMGRPGIEAKDNLATLKEQGLSKKPADTSYALKVTYPYRSRSYGTQVHRLLVQHGFAPDLYLEFAPAFEPSHYGLEDYDPLICYHLMEDLVEPTRTNSGWITLDEFAEEARADAVLYKAGIQRSLDRIIGLLQANAMVHGDMQPNNLMIRVQIRNGVMRPLFREDLKIIDIRVIDFDWADIGQDKMGAQS